MPPRFCVQCFMGTISFNPDNDSIKVLAHFIDRKGSLKKVVLVKITHLRNTIELNLSLAGETLGPILSSVKQNIFLPISRFVREAALSLKMCISYFLGIPFIFRSTSSFLYSGFIPFYKRHFDFLEEGYMRCDCLFQKMHPLLSPMLKHPDALTIV